MKLDFDLANVKVVEFGVGSEDPAGQRFVSVPVDSGVQRVLLEMANATWAEMLASEDGATKYEPAEKHAATDYLYLPLADGLAKSVRDLHEVDDLAIDTSALKDPSALFCYFARFTDNKKRRLSALRRASQFKGVLKSRNRLIRMLDDTLEIIEDRVFRLDNDFDLLADSANVHILRPSGFEFAGKLQQAILDAVPENIEVVRKDLVFVDFEGIQEYAVKHPRAARYLASIRGQSETKNINKGKLKSYCKRVGVSVRERNGKLIVEAGHEMDFLGVLDRRLYDVELVPGAAELYRAASRTKING